MKHDVVIHVRNCEARVTPGQLIVLPGDTVTFQIINAEATLLFPQIILYDEERRPVDRIRLTPEMKAVSAPLTIDGDVGVYPYAVHSLTRNSFAKGASDPIIIIRRQT